MSGPGGSVIAVVRPYRVSTTVPDGGPATAPWSSGTVEGLVFAPDPDGAAWRQLRDRHGVGRKADRKALGADADVRPVYPFRLRRLGIAGPGAAGTPVYAVSVEEAVGWARAAHGDDGCAEACDDLDVLFTLDETELLRQARYIWPERTIRARAPGIWDRMKWDRDHRAIRLATLSQAVYAIRLAMLLPWFGAPAEKQTHAGNPDIAKSWDRRKAEARHLPNIPGDVVADMVTRFGRAVVPFSASDTMLLERFVRAYGYEAEGMRWSEIAALWEAGPAGLERARLDGSMGQGEAFRHGPIYRA